MKIHTFKARDSFELGKQFGVAYKKNGLDVEYIQIQPALYARQLRIYKKHFPQFLEELRGVAAVLDCDVDKLIYSFIAAPTERLMAHPRFTRTACSVFGFSKGDDLFVGRNYDWLPQTEDWFQIYKVQNPKTYSYLVVSDMDVYQQPTQPEDLRYLPIDCINEKGLFIGLTASINNDVSFGLWSMHIIKLIAETCTNVAEAIEVFKTVPHNCTKNFFLADASGAMAVVEHFSGKRIKIVYPENDLLIKTNHYIDPAFAKKDKILWYKPTNTTFLRYYEILREVNLRRKTFQQKDIPDILNRNGSYLLQNTPTARSIWTLSLNMTKRKYVLYYDLFGKRKSIALKL